MVRYCLEIQTEEAVIHRVDCAEFDLATLLGLGCVADLGEFPSLSEALAAIKHTRPNAVRCRQCCQAEVKYLPQRWQLAIASAVVVTSS